jgi:hypothetical protein
MKENDDRQKFQKMMSDLTLNIYSSSGDLKFHKKLIIASYTESMGMDNEVEKYIATFKAPADDMGNSFLHLNYKLQEDEKYIYLKGIRKEKKVTGADMKLSFFGSDFTNGDAGKPDYSYYNYTYLRDEKINFKGKDFDCYVVEGVTKNDKIKNDTGYSKIISFLEKKTRLTLKRELYDVDGTKIKEQRLLSFVSQNNVKGHKVYFETGLEMKNVKTGSHTDLLFSNYKFENDAAIRTDIFSIQYLTRKWW